MTIKKEPQNLFSSTSVLSIMGFCYFTVISPAIDKYAESKLTREETIKTLNGIVYALLASSLTLFDPKVYTPKLIPGRNKEKALDNITELLSPTVSEVKEVVLETVKEVINSNSTTNSTIKDITNLFKIGDLIDKKIELNSNNNSIINKDLLINKQQTNITLTNKEETFYKFELVDSSILADSKKIKVDAGTTINIDSYDASNILSNHIKFTINNTTLYAFIPHIYIKDNDKEVELVIAKEPIKEDIKPINDPNYLRPTIEQCNKLYQTTLTQEEYKDLINCLNTFGINTKLDVSYFLTHTAHESGGLRYMKELGDYDYFSKNYDYRDDLGNTEPGDGAKYAGVSPLQMTGKFWYQEFANYMKDPNIMKGVDYVASKFFFSPSGFWWYKNDMSNFINNEGADIYSTCYRINGGYNGIEQRIAYYEHCKKIFNIA